MKTMAADFGLERQGVLLADASAGLGIASRLGIGKVRHLHTQALWLQRKVADKEISLKKIPGPENVADLPTKHVDAGTMQKLLRLMGFERREGVSKLALAKAKNAE